MLFQFKQRLRLILNHSQELNRRVEIENQLLRMANGKEPLPSKSECKIMALKLGTPKKYWRRGWVEKQTE